MQQQTANDWIDVRDDRGRLLFKWSPRLGCLELPQRQREPGGTRHHVVYQRVPLSVFTPPARDEQTVDTAMAVVV